jgi:hypothetical protein
MCNHKKSTVYPPHRSNNPLRHSKPNEEDEGIAELLQETLESQVAFVPEKGCQNDRKYSNIDFAIIYFYDMTNFERLLRILFQPIQENLVGNTLFEHSLESRVMPKFHTPTLLSDGAWKIRGNKQFGMSRSHLYGAQLTRGNRSRTLILSSIDVVVEAIFPASDIPILVERMKMFNEWFKHRDLDDDLSEWNPKTSFEIADGVLRVR